MVLGILAVGFLGFMGLLLAAFLYGAARVMKPPKRGGGGTQMFSSGRGGG